LFIRDPETKKLFHVDPAKLVRIIVNESEGKTPEQYIIRDMNLNFKDMVATTPHITNGNITGGGSGYQSGGVRGMVGNAPQQAGSRYQQGEGEVAINAEHIVHLSLSEGLDNNYPFGNSLLLDKRSLGFKFRILVRSKSMTFGLFLIFHAVCP